jgi:2',3'-cyclic-nucleotide 2'-phosphodiesterase (5'-nucleotidase family)
MQSNKSQKSYKNVIILGVLAIVALVFLVPRYVKVDAVLWNVGYYDKKVTILNTADMLGHVLYYEREGADFTLDQNSMEMGAALIKGLADQYRAENPNTLFFDSGDFFSGTGEANVNQGEGTVKIANLMKYDAMTLGQHDFSWGVDRILEIKSQLELPLLVANVYKDGQPAFETHKIFELDGLKIGVFGLTSDQFLQDLQIHGAHTMTYEDPVPIAKKVVAQLKEEGADAIILVSHIGDYYDKTWILPEVDGIDLVLSGRGFVLYKKAEKEGSTYVAEAGAFGSHLGVAQMYFRNGKVAKVTWEVVKTSDRSLEDPAVAEVVKAYNEQAIIIGQEVIVESDVDLDGTRTAVRTRETNFTNLIADAMRDIGQADIALFNAGIIRESVPKGKVTLYQLERAMPFYNSLVTIEVDGETIYQAIERGLETWPNGVHNGGFPQVSGIKYVIDASQPAGKRLKSVEYQGQPLDRNAKYKLAITDYLLTGGDRYDMFEDKPVLTRGNLLKDVVGTYLKKTQTVPTGTDGRIEVINQRYK